MKNAKAETKDSQTKKAYDVEASKMVRGENHKARMEDEKAPEGLLLDMQFPTVLGCLGYVGKKSELCPIRM